jgi:hypothetical protein
MLREPSGGSGRTDEALALITPVVGQISEGHDTLDYVYAETLLDTLGELTPAAGRLESAAQDLEPEPGTVEPGTRTF